MIMMGVGESDNEEEEGWGRLRLLVCPLETPPFESEFLGAFNSLTGFFQLESDRSFVTFVGNTIQRWSDRGAHLMDFHPAVSRLTTVIEIDDKRLASCGGRHFMVWDKGIGKCIASFVDDDTLSDIKPSKRHSSRIYAIYENKVRIRCLETYSVIRQVATSVNPNVFELSDGRIAYFNVRETGVFSEMFTQKNASIITVFEIFQTIELKHKNSIEANDEPPQFYSRHAPNISESVDKTILMATLYSGSVVIWNSWTGERLQEFKDFPLGEFIQFILEPIEGLILFNSSQSLKMWDIRSRECVFVKHTKGDFFGHEIISLADGRLMTYKRREASSVTVYSTFQTLVLAHRKTTVRFTDLGNYAAMICYDRRQSLVHACCFTIGRFYKDIEPLSKCLPPELFELCLQCHQALPDRAWTPMTRHLQTDFVPKLRVLVTL